MREMLEKITSQFKSLTNEQLRDIVRAAKAEQKRRLKERLAKTKTNHSEYVMITATVESIDNLKRYTIFGIPVHKHIYRWVYKLKDFTVPHPYKKHLAKLLEDFNEFRTSSLLLKTECPKEGDLVRVKIKNTGELITKEDLESAKIIEVIND
jgi:hypothetical protein